VELHDLGQDRHGDLVGRHIAEIQTRSPATICANVVS
jgi:hypothetical protein